MQVPYTQPIMTYDYPQLKSLPRIPFHLIPRLSIMHCGPRKHLPPQGSPAPRDAGVSERCQQKPASLDSACGYPNSKGSDGCFQIPCQELWEHPLYASLCLLHPINTNTSRRQICMYKESFLLVCTWFLQNISPHIKPHFKMCVLHQT